MINDDHSHLRPDGTRKKPSRHPSQQPDLFDWGATANETRAAAYRGSKPKASRRQDEIAAYVRSCGQHGTTRDSIANVLAMPLQSVCGPVLALLRDGRLREDGRKRATSTGSMAAVLVATGSNHG